MSTSSRHVTKTVSFVLLMSFLLVGSSLAQLQSPAEFLGYELGDRFTPHHRVAAYVEHVGEMSPMVRLVKYGETNEKRPLYLAIVSDMLDDSAIEAARLNNLALARATDATGDQDGARPIVWLSYNVHGNESVSTEAALKVLYDLANPANSQTKQWLDNTIVVVDPCINPDGRDRYVNWYNRAVGEFPNANGDDWAHDEPWPGGRTNHYFFDLNRDWAWATQKETQQRLVQYKKWMPQVHVDFHEQGVNSPYYFAPAARPVHEDITSWQYELQEIIGRNHAKYFDQNNWLYFTKEVFDLFYPGYGDSWPTFNGAVGMTYEQAGSGRAGLGIETAEGDTLTLADRIAHHHATSLSTIEATSLNASRVISEFADYFKSGVEDPPGKYAGYVVSMAKAPDATSDLISHLDVQGIRYGFAAGDQSVRGFVYKDASEGAFQISKGDLVIPSAQPQARLVKALFEPMAVLEDSLTYDITAWAQPYAYGVPSVATSDAVRLGERPASITTAVETDGEPYAYVVEWKSVRDQKFVAALLRAGVNIRMASRPFEIDGHRFGHGTVVITRAGNDDVGDQLDALVSKAANDFVQPVTTVRSGFVGDGSDFGSGAFQFIDAPSIAVLGGERVSSSSLGQIWHYFDQVLEYPITIIPAENFGGTSLADYDVIVMPSGSYGRALPDEQLKDLTEWLRSGGRLVAIDRAVSFLAGKKGFELESRKRDEDTTAVGPDESQWGNESRRRISGSVSGAIYKVAVDPTHPIGFGLGDTYYALKNSSSAYELMKRGKGWNVGVVTSGKPVSGFAGYETIGHQEKSVAIASQRVGRGSVVYLVDDPLYRGFWRVGNQLFGNAVFAR